MAARTPKRSRKATAGSSKRAQPRGKAIPLYSPDEFGASGQLLVFKKMFDSFDIDGSGAITKQDFGQLVRLIGYNPTGAQLKSWESEFESKESPNKIEFHNFLTVMSRLVQAYATPDEIDDEVIKAFEEFDPQKCETVKLSDLRHLMTEDGEDPLTDVEWEELAKHAAATRDGEVNYAEFVRHMRKD